MTFYDWTLVLCTSAKCLDSNVLGVGESGTGQVALVELQGAPDRVKAGSPEGSA